MNHIISLRPVNWRFPLQRMGAFTAMSVLIVSVLTVMVFHPEVSPLYHIVGAVAPGRLAVNLPVWFSGVGNGVAAVTGFIATKGIWIAVFMAIAAIVAAGYGFLFGWRRLTVVNHTLEFDSLPEGFDGYRIVQISDLHIGTYRRAPGVVEKMVAQVNAMDADMIVFTGDLVNCSPDEVEPFVQILSRLQARDGIVSVMGNHDYCVYRRYESPREHVSAIRRLQQVQREGLGWRLLLNENMVVERNGDSVAIVGVENAGKGFVDHANLPKAMAGVENGVFTIMLSHDPGHWRREILPATDAQLTLAGHTHAMQCRLGPVSPSRLLYREWSGVYREGDRLLHVNPGTGSNVPFRLGARPEVTLLTLRRVS